VKLPGASVIPSCLAYVLVGVAVGLVLHYHPPLLQPAPDEFAWIPAGRFIMGSPETEPGRDPSEVPHPVTLSGFWLARWPVTQEAWLQVMPGNPSAFRGSGRLPVEGITWYDAIAYCNLRSQQEGLQSSYRFEGEGTDPRRWPQGWKQHRHDRISCDWNASGYRLPTEAEWEYACRAGTTTATFFGPVLTSRSANFNGNEPYGTTETGPNLKGTAPVGSYPPNAWGLYDMHGNISQWCWDWYGDYSSTPQVDPRGPKAPGLRRVHRGGSWFSHGVDLRAAARFSDTPHFRLDMLPGGFRVVRGGSQP